MHLAMVGEGGLAQTIRAGAVQAEPVWLDLDGTVEKTIRLIGDAAADGVELLAFPELWIPGYPVFQSYTDSALEMPYVLDYRQNALGVDSAQMARIRAAAREHHVSLLLGFAEREGRSLYMAQSLINEQGEIVFVRRKLKPTYQERCLFGQGDGSDLAVAETRLGRIGALNCYEHLQPLIKFALMGLQEQIHVASWPVLDFFGGEMMSGATISAVTRCYAIETGTFVLMSNTIFTGEGRRIFSRHGAAIPEFCGGGHARIFGPDGGVLSDALDPAAEGIVIADLDLDALEFASFFTDPVGHYARPDIFSLSVDRRRKRPIAFFGATPATLNECDVGGDSATPGDASGEKDGLAAASGSLAKTGS
jgi:aliphatic nitrilase